MTLKQTIKLLLVGSFVVLSSFFITNTPTFAANGANGCETETAILKCSDVNDSGKIENTGVWSILRTAIQILTAGIGIAAVAGVVWASILYATAAGSSEQTKKAVTVIVNVAVGIIAYALMFSLLNFLIPGGVFA